MMKNGALSINKKKDYGKWRAISLSAVYLLMGIHIAHWKIAGTTLAPLELNEVLYTLHLGVITAGFIFMGLAMISTVIAGRFFCGWMCHILALEDLSEWLLLKMGIKPRYIRSRTLLFIPFIAMGYMFILPQIERLYKGLPAVALKVQTDSEGWASFMTNDFWRNLPGIGITLLTFFICGFLIIYLLGSRSFCTYACPYGAIFSITDRLAPGKIKLTGDCNQCGICTSVCSSHVKVHHEVRHFSKVVDPNCMKDMDCVMACPNDALSYGFTKPSFFQSLKNIKSVKKHYDFTMAEDIILLSLFGLFLVMFFGLYDSVAFLLAVALSIIFAFTAIKTKRLLTSDFSKIGNFVLKSSGRLNTNGKVFIAVVAAAFMFSIHSSYIRYHQLTGEHYYNNYASSLTESKSISNESHLSGDLKKAEYHLKVSYDFGLYRSAALLRQLASMAMAGNDQPKAVSYLEGLHSKMPEDIEAALKLSKLYILGNNHAKAALLLKDVCETEVYSDKDKKHKSEAFITLGHLEERNGFASEALKLYMLGLETYSENAEGHLAAGVLLVRSGRPMEAEPYLKKAALHYTNSPLIENNLASVYLALKKYELAGRHLQTLVNMQPDNISAQYNLAMINYKTGYRDEAIRKLNVIISKYPDHANARKALAMINNEP